MVTATRGGRSGWLQELSPRCSPASWASSTNRWRLPPLPFSASLPSTFISTPRKDQTDLRPRRPHRRLRLRAPRFRGRQSGGPRTWNGHPFELRHLSPEQPIWGLHRQRSQVHHCRMGSARLLLEPDWPTGAASVSCPRELPTFGTRSTAAASRSTYGVCGRLTAFARVDARRRPHTPDFSCPVPIHKFEAGVSLGHLLIEGPFGPRSPAKEMP